MSSRHEEKQRRREERLAQEQATAKAAARGRRMRLIGGGLLAVAGAVALVVALTAGGGDDMQGGPAPKARGAAKAKLPPVAIAELSAAAKAAGCTLGNPASQGRDHTTKAVDYKSEPPSSGPHDPTSAQDGVYEPGNEPKVGLLVHALEHGRVIIQYRKGLEPQRVRQLEALFNERNGYHTILVRDETGMPYDVAATAWTHVLGCKSFDDKGFDALRAFRVRYTDKGPEFIP